MKRKADSVRGSIRSKHACLRYSEFELKRKQHVKRFNCVRFGLKRKLDFVRGSYRFKTCMHELYYVWNES